MALRQAEEPERQSMPMLTRALAPCEPQEGLPWSLIPVSTHQLEPSPGLSLSFHTLPGPGHTHARARDSFSLQGVHLQGRGTDTGFRVRWSLAGHRGQLYPTGSSSSSCLPSFLRSLRPLPQSYMKESPGLLLWQGGPGQMEGLTSSTLCPAWCQVAFHGGLCWMGDGLLEKLHPRWTFSKPHDGAGLLCPFGLYGFSCSTKVTAIPCELLGKH